MIVFVQGCWYAMGRSRTCIWQSFNERSLHQWNHQVSRVISRTKLCGNKYFIDSFTTFIVKTVEIGISSCVYSLQVAIPSPNSIILSILCRPQRILLSSDDSVETIELQKDGCHHFKSCVVQDRLFCNCCCVCNPKENKQLTIFILPFTQNYWTASKALKLSFSGCTRQPVRIPTYPISDSGRGVRHIEVCSDI